PSPPRDCQSSIGHVYLRKPAVVVPANAGTHTPRLLNRAMGLVAFTTIKPGGYGSRRSPGRLGALQSADLIDRPDQVLDFLGVRAELLGELVEIGVCHSREAGLVDIGDDLDPDRFQLVLRLVFELDCLRWLVLVDLIGRGLHPSLLLRRQAVP